MTWNWLTLFSSSTVLLCGEIFVWLVKQWLYLVLITNFWKYFRSSLFLKNFKKSTGDTCNRVLYLAKLHGYIFQFIKKWLHHRYFLVNFPKFFRLTEQLLVKLDRKQNWVALNDIRASSFVKRSSKRESPFANLKLCGAEAKNR